MNLQMNPLGSLPHEYSGMTIEETARRMADLGLTAAQVDPRDPKIRLNGELPSATRALEVKEIFERHGIKIVALAAYSNLIDPDLQRRESTLSAFERMIHLCEPFGTTYIATETGGLDPVNPWADSPLNHTEKAWETLLPIIDRLRKRAVSAGSQILLEGYVNNVLSSTEKAIRMIKELGKDGLGFVLDPFNYFRPDDFQNQEQAFARVFESISDNAPIAHAKDAVYKDGWLLTPKVGDGHADFSIYAKWLAQNKPDIPLLMEHLQFDELPECTRRIVDAYKG